MLRLAFDFIITWRETRTRPNAYVNLGGKNCYLIVYTPFVVSFSVVTFARSR